MLSQCRKSGGVLWFTEQEDRCQTLLLISLKRKQDCLKGFLIIFKSVILTKNSKAGLSSLRFKVYIVQIISLFLI